MSARFHFRRFVAFFCLMAVVLAALAPASVSLPPGILVELSFLIVVAVSVLLFHVDEQIPPQHVPALAAFSPRPPPAR